MADYLHVAAIEDCKPHAHSFTVRGLKGRKCALLPPSGLPDRCAHHDLEDFLITTIIRIVNRRVGAAAKEDTENIEPKQ